MQAEVETIALPVAGLVAAREAFGESLDWADAPYLYAADSSLRLILSYVLSHNVVEHRTRFALRAAVPHVGRLRILNIISEEHPELAHLLHAYNSYRGFPEKHKKGDLDLDRAQKKFNQRFTSNAVNKPLRSIIKAGGDVISSRANRNPVTQFSLQFAQAIGIK